MKVADDMRQFLGNVDFNIDQPDRWHPALRKGLDFVGEFNKCRYGIVGKVWAETKVYTAADFDGKVAKAKETIEKDFEVLQRKDTKFGAAMLLVAKLDRCTGATSDAPKLFVEVYVDGSWLDIGPLTGRPASAGKLLAAGKPTFFAVWRKLEKFGDVALLSHFLEEVGLTAGSPGKRARTFNKILKKAGIAEKVQRQSVPNHPGQKPWVASKAALKTILSYL